MRTKVASVEELCFITKITFWLQLATNNIHLVEREGWKRVSKLGRERLEESSPSLVHRDCGKVGIESSESQS